MREKVIEEYLRDEIKKLGGKAFKFISPGNNGVPDRLVCLPGGEIVFVELKAPGKKSTANQNLQQKRLKNLGFLVYNEIDSKEKVDEIIDYCREIVVMHM
ncbi:VRR-NUC domain-containing protein [Tissierella sp.]|jgi:hypothetical protein|uniref:VRR-NUC domain-containing protein n=1 Tax=Tissierella sp. TaxID=41274 RepID=UPI003037E9F1